MSRLLLPVALLAIGGVAWLLATEPADVQPQANPTGASPSSRLGTPSLRAHQADDVPPPWVLSPPEVSSNPESGSGQNPCLPPDPGFGSYEGWDEGLPKGHMLAPKHPAKDPEGNVRVVFHFHGHEAVRKEWVQITGDVVLVALDLGNESSAYAEEFTESSHFGSLVKSAEQRLEQHLGHTVAFGRFGLAAWSAGYAAVRAILSGEFQSRVNAVVLLDGLHASTLESAAGRAELAPFVKFAQRAARDEGLMFVSHSSIEPPDYVSTTHGTNYLIWALGGNPQPVSDTKTFPAGLQLYRRYDEGGFHALGFRGVTPADHCAQVALYRYVLQTYLLPRWGLAPRRE